LGRLYKAAARKNWDKGLWELTLASHPVGLAEKLDQIQIPVLEIKGDDDRIAHTKQSIRLGKELSNARLVIIPN
jgi:pimeloyl-ACP methyl ester carboxylesterase